MGLLNGQTILVTGAGGLIGGALVPRLQGARVVRAAHGGAAGGPDRIVVGELHEADWSQALVGVDTVIHLAGVGGASTPHATPFEIERTNGQGLIRLCEAAQAAGIRRFVFASSAKALAEYTPPGRALTETDEPLDGRSLYGLAKYGAERMFVRRFPNLPTIVLRLPMVVADDGRGAMAPLVRYVRRGRPVPVPQPGNHRSILTLDQAAEAFVRAAALDGPTGLYHVADPAARSAEALVRAAGAIAGRKPHIVRVPRALGRWLASIPFAAPTAQRLFADLVVDGARFQAAFGALPPARLPGEEAA